MATNKKNGAVKPQGLQGGGGQQSGGTRLRGESGKGSGGNQKPNQGEGGLVGRKGGARGK